MPDSSRGARFPMTLALMFEFNTLMRRLVTVSVLVGALLLGGCRGMESDRPPIHPNLNMDMQNRFDPQEENPLFADNAAMRTPPRGTVARGLLGEDTRYHEGRNEDGEYIAQAPVPVTRALLERGRERYDIYCTVCHGGAGDGEGIIMEGDFGYTPAPSFHEDRLREEADGYFYDVITNGIRNMPSYAQQIPVADRWAIVAYIRALQRSQGATEDDLPEGVLSRLEQDGSVDSEETQVTGD